MGYFPMPNYCACFASVRFCRTVGRAQVKLDTNGPHVFRPAVWGKWAGTQPAFGAGGRADQKQAWNYLINNLSPFKQPINQFRPCPTSWTRADRVLTDKETDAYAPFSDAMSMT